MKNLSYRVLYRDENDVTRFLCISGVSDFNINVAVRIAYIYGGKVIASEYRGQLG